MAYIYKVTNQVVSYFEMLDYVAMYGEWTSPRGIHTSELSNVTIEHMQPHTVLMTGIGRELSTGLAALEALQLIGGFSDVDLTTRVAPRYKDFLDGESFHGAYGLRTQYKLGLVAERLRQDRETRRACATMWDDRLDLSHEGMHDYPCTMHVNFRISGSNNVGGQRLDMTVVMRSNDLWLGYPYDVVQFSIMHSTMAAFLGIPTGTYTHIVHSLHLYSRDLPKVHELIEEQHDTFNPRPSLAGGINAMSPLWTDVQARARALCYEPETVTTRTSAEEWLKNVSIAKIARGE